MASDRQRLAKYIRSTNQRRILIDLADRHGWTRGAEIGVLRGKTLFSLLDACPNLSMIGVDQWKRLPLRSDQCAETYDPFDMDHLRRSVEHRAKFYDGRCELLIGDSVAMADHVSPNTLDFVFIDGDHTEFGVRRDIEAWKSKIKNGGMLLGHDISWPTVRKAVDELCPLWIPYGEEVWGVFII